MTYHQWSAASPFSFSRSIFKFEEDNFDQEIVTHTSVSYGPIVCAFFGNFEAYNLSEKGKDPRFLVSMSSYTAAWGLIILSLWFFALEDYIHYSKVRFWISYQASIQLWAQKASD